MDWLHVGTTNASASAIQTTATPALSAGWQADDLYVLIARAGSSPSAPAGYTLLPCFDNTEIIKGWWKKATATEVAPVVSGSLGNTRAILSIFRGIDLTTPFDASADQTNTNTTATTAPSIVVARAMSLLIHFAGTASGARTHTPPAGFTEPVNGEMDALYISYQFDVPAGATGAKAGTLSAAADTRAALASFLSPVVHPLAGTSAGVGDQTGALTVARVLAGTSAGTGDATGVLRREARLTGDSAATGDATGNLAVDRALAGVTSGAGDATGALDRAVSLAGASAGVGDATGNLTVTGVPVDHPLSGVSAGVGEASGALAVDRTLTGASAGAGATAGDLTVDRGLSGVSAGAGGLTALLRLTVSLTGVAAGMGDLTGALAPARALAGVSVGVAGGTGTLSNVYPPVVILTAPAMPGVLTARASPGVVTARPTPTLTARDEMDVVTARKT